MDRNARPAAVVGARHTVPRVRRASTRVAKVFLAIMLGMFASVFWLAKFPMGWIQTGVDALKGVVAPTLAATPMMQSLVTDGLLGGVGAFLVFLPQIQIGRAHV